jgi:hypothetical protein
MTGAGPELPRGLVSGTLVKILAFDHGYAEVEYLGNKFNVFMTYLDTGWEYLVGGTRWLDESHPLVLAVKRWEAKRSKQTQR